MSGSRQRWGLGAPPYLRHTHLTLGPAADCAGGTREDMREQMGAGVASLLQQPGSIRRCAAAAPAPCPPDLPSLLGRGQAGHSRHSCDTDMLPLTCFHDCCRAPACRPAAAWLCAPTTSAAPPTRSWCCPPCCPWLPAASGQLLPPHGPQGRAAWPASRSQRSPCSRPSLPPLVWMLAGARMDPPSLLSSPPRSAPLRAFPSLQPGPHFHPPHQRRPEDAAAGEVRGPHVG